MSKLDFNNKAKIITQMIPYLDIYKDQDFVITLTGSTLTDPELFENFIYDIVLLSQAGINPIIVHEGNNYVNAMLNKHKIKQVFQDEMRVTDENIIEITEMVLSGLLNKQIVAAINAAGGKAVGLSGKDANLFESKKLRFTKKDPESNIQKIFDLGFIGEITMINPDIISTLVEDDFIPVISPISTSDTGETLHLHAEHVASALAASLTANKLIILCEDQPIFGDEIIKQISSSKGKEILMKKAIKPELSVKLENCITAVENLTEMAHLIDCKIEHGLLLEVFTDDRIGVVIFADGNF
jgi:acetylglutamate kinase